MLVQVKSGCQLRSNEVRKGLFRLVMDRSVYVRIGQVVSKDNSG
jgi:hypothetical protein